MPPHRLTLPSRGSSSTTASLTPTAGIQNAYQHEQECSLLRGRRSYARKATLTRPTAAAAAAGVGVVAGTRGQNVGPLCSTSSSSSSSSGKPPSRFGKGSWESDDDGGDGGSNGDSAATADAASGAAGAADGAAAEPASLSAGVGGAGAGGDGAGAEEIGNPDTRTALKRKLFKKGIIYQADYVLGVIMLAF